MIITPHQQLATFARQRATAHADFEQSMAEIALAQQQARIEIQQLERRLVELHRHIQDQQEAYTNTVAATIRDETAVALAALEQSYASLRSAASYWTQFTELRQQRLTLEAANPQLQEELSAYYRFEQTGRELIQELPAMHRNLLLQAQQQLAERLQPCIELNAKEQELTHNPTVSIQLIVAHDEATGEIFCALPLPANPHTLPSEVRQALEEVGAILLNAVGNIQQAADWFIAELSVEIWGTFAAVHILANYTGHRPLVEALHELVSEQLHKHDHFGQLTLDTNTTEMHIEAWKLMQASVLNNVVVTEVEAEPTIPVNEWYAAHDLRSWARPVKVSEGSQWTTQARRLRTALVRMVAHGSIGANPVDGQTLWECLPPPHQEAMRKGLGQLLDMGVLMPIEETQPQLIVINPERINEVQMLINRDVPEAWRSTLHEVP